MGGLQLMGGLPPQRERGQVLVIVALGIALLLAAAGIAIDVGRFYSERRFLQNAADAAALAAANALVRGDSDANAIVAAQDTLARNFLGDPNGVVASLPPATPEYESGHAGDPAYLVNGILISGGEVRVAVRNEIGYSFGRVIGLGSQPIGARARVRLQGDLLPIAVRRYINTPGPNAGATEPCADNPSWFTDYFATAETSCLGSETDAVRRMPPKPGASFDALDPGSDRLNHGPILAILGQGAQPSNSADFRGFVALDIRNFASTSSQLYYNGVERSTNANTLKAMQAGWVATGYPGPMFPSVISPPDPNDQVAIMSGNSTGIAIDAFNDRFAPGDEILVLVYPGNVMAIPDFTITPPGQLDLPATGVTANAGSFKVSRNKEFVGAVDLSTLADPLDLENPLTAGAMTGTPAITYTPNLFTPSEGSGTTVTLTNVTTASAIEGIYTIWVQGQAGSPYFTTKVQPIAVKIGTVVKDFTFTSATTSVDVVSGATATFDLELTNSPNKNTAFGGPGVSLSVDTPLPSGVGAISFTPATVSPTKTGAHSTLSIPTGTMAPGIHTFTVRATGMNADSRKVTHLIQLTVNVNGVGSGGNQAYVDISGFAVMRIAAADANAVSAYAISPVITDMNDPQLRRGQVARLVPWN